MPRVLPRVPLLLPPLACILLLVALPAAQAQAPAADEAFFESRIRPLFLEHCFECHSEDVAESGLRVDSRAALLQGGERGPAILPGDPTGSLLMLAVRHADQLHMPPERKISQREIADLTAWIAAGAVWPGDEGVPSLPPVAVAGGERELTAEERSFWAFQKPVAGPLPAVQNAAWVQSPVDHFILARLEAAGLSPAPPADRRTLLRRVTLDLCGLPPTPQELADFLADQQPGAWERVVERLLASPRYGERWGRRWLDVARYADSNGLDENLAYASAFRYRDYVVRAFNSDKPYHRFLEEQLAGDLLAAENKPAAAGDISRFDPLVATGFLAVGAKMLAEDDPQKMQMDIIDEQLDTLGQAVLGLTLGCARCHDHKFDPISMGDYYGLAGVLKSTKTMENFSVVARWQERPLATPEQVAALDEQRRQVAAVQGEIDALTRRANDALRHAALDRTADYLRYAQLTLAREQQARQGAPLGRRPASELPAGSILLEAEEYARGNVIQMRDGYGEGIGVLVNRGETPNFTEYDLDLPAAGAYRLELRYAAESPRPCQVLVDGRLVLPAAAGQATGGWYPQSQVWQVEGRLELPSGRSVLRLEQPQFFPHIDKLLLVPVAVLPEEQPQDGDLAVRLGLDPAATAGDLRPRVLGQWTALLARTADSPPPLLAPWWALVRGQPLEQAAALSPAAARLLAEPRPSDLPGLAARYQELLTAAAAPAPAEQAPADATPSDAAAPDPALAEAKAFLDDPQGPFALPPQPEAEYAPPDAARLAELKASKQSLEAALPVLPEAMVVSEGTPEDLRIHLRGSHVTLGEVAPRRLPRIFGGQPLELSPGASGRRELAAWLVQEDHPLTSRVLVNRVWQGHFGEGLVRSPDNFGRLGERPTHPELLDWLAVDFVRSGWSLKALHRRIVLSSAYQASSRYDAAAALADPENRLLWRMPRRRLEAEAIRDSLLAVGGELDLTMGGSLLPTPNRQYVTSTANVNPLIYDTRRRAVYLPVVRSALYDFFAAFDFGDPSVIQGRRESTTVAPQALYMLNGELVARQAQALAQQLLEEQQQDAAADQQRVQWLYERVLCRPPTAEEIEDALAFVAGLEQDLAIGQSAGGQSAEGSTPASLPPGAQTAQLQAWKSLCRVLLGSNEFVFVD